MWVLKSIVSAIYGYCHRSSESDYFDKDIMANFIGPDHQIQKGYIAIFFSSAQEEIDDLEKGLQSMDYEMVERAAHSLKSNAALMGLKKLESLSLLFEQAANAQNSKYLTDNLFPLHQCIDTTFHILECYVEE
eukprot:TRINITY_DN12098_c0_g1_i1.p1 TRINITY_DN12098_c0_g1~~TRINITY_DN12098_c0_g1_i1.p1  ORF type:complete len:133 (-),score=26.50 TRINITY_DN12098_c0_g1_i1:90-488(-)